MFEPYQGHVIDISTIFLFLDACNGSNFHQRNMHATQKIIFNVELLGPYWAIFGPYQDHVLAISNICLLIDVLDGTNFH